MLFCLIRIICRLTNWCAYESLNFVKVMKRLIPSKWAKVERFQSLSSNSEKFEFLLLCICVVHKIILCIRRLKKNIKKPKFKDKIRHSATNGNFELVVFRLCGRTCKVLDTSSCHQFFVQKWSNTKFVLMGCVIHFCFCLLWAILIRKFYQLIQQECSKLGWFSLFLT